MDVVEKQALVSRHLRAEGHGDIEGAVAVYTDDVEHDAVGFPGSPCHGKDRARDFYEHLTANFRTESEDVLHRYETDDAIILEQMTTGTVVGSMLGRQGHGRRINFRVLHIFEFKGRLISRENVWLDTAAIIDQLS